MYLGGLFYHYNDITMGAMASQITSLAIVYPTVHSGTDQRKCQSPTLLAFVKGIHRWPANSPHKSPVTRKMFPFDDVIMINTVYMGFGHGLISSDIPLFSVGCNRPSMSQYHGDLAKPPLELDMDMSLHSMFAITYLCPKFDAGNLMNEPMLADPSHV